MSFIKNISTHETSDPEIIAAYKQSKDLKSLGNLYEPYMELVFGVCLKYLKNTKLAKDAVMHIFEELIEKVLRHNIDNFKNWLYALARNYCLMQLRSPRHLKTVELNATIMQSKDETHLHLIYEKEADLQRLEKCLKKLVTEQKESVELFYLKNKCYREITVITGKDINKVRSLIQNGKRNLKICMETTLQRKV